MNYFTITGFVCGLLLCGIPENPFSIIKQKDIQKPANHIEVYFSPNGGCTDAIVGEINKSKKNIKIQAYGFTSAPIAQALLVAKERGVSLDVILDKCNESEKYSAAKMFENHGVICMIDRKPAIAHSKIMIIDEETIITGSFNFTKAAEDKNTENLLIIRNNPELVKAYLNNFDNRLRESSFYRIDRP